MRFLIAIALISFFQLQVSGQQISYKIPTGYEKDISNEDYKTLVDFSIFIISKRFKIDQVTDGRVQLKPGEEVETLNLHNLVLKCAAIKDHSKWNEIIKAHFEGLFASIEEKKKIDLQNFEAVKKFLSIRIYTTETVDRWGGVEKLIARKDLDGTYTLLMLDLPGAFTAVQRSAFALWNKDTAEVFKLAQANVNQQKVEKVTQVFDIDGTQVEISFLGNENYAGSYALDLARNSPELIGEWGSIVAIPNKGLVNICKITKARPVDFVKFIQRTKPLIQNSFDSHPQPISNAFFWYYNGKFTRVVVTSAPNGDVNVISPSGLTELMTAEK